MGWKCFWLGCKWEKLMEHFGKRETLRTDVCQRCHSHRTVTL